MKKQREKNCSRLDREKHDELLKKKWGGRKQTKKTRQLKGQA
jgi:hypothetical protein